MNELKLSPWHLKYFYDTVRLQSLTKSSDCNGITRPAISKAIRSLEDVLEVDLLFHQKRNVEVTPHGRLLYERIPSILSSLSELKEHVQGSSNVPKGILRIGTSHSLALSIFPRLFKTLRNKYPELKLTLQLGRTEILRNWISDGVVDICVTLDDQKLSGFRHYPIAKGEFVLFGESKIRQGPVLITFDRPEVRMLHRWLKEKMGGGEHEVIEIDSWEVLLRFAKEGLGSALVPDFVFKVDRNRAHHKAVPIDCPYKMIAFTNRSAHRSANIEAFVNELKSSV